MDFILAHKGQEIMISVNLKLLWITTIFPPPGSFLRQKILHGMLWGIDQTQLYIGIRHPDGPLEET